MRISVLALCLVAIARAGDAPQGHVRADGRWLLDASGRVLILHGVNVANASKHPPYLPWQTRKDFEQIARWGFNSVRLLTVWAAIEPRPGQYDDAYIAKLAERVAWCRELGLWVVLDMHQDLYSEQYGADGAPPWACLDDGLRAGPRQRAWFLNYLQPPVLRAFDNFWANKPGPGGVGLQDRFAAAWRHLARRFRDEKAVIGYDLLNEPFLGSAIQAAILSYANAAAQLTTAETKLKLLAALASGDPASHFDGLAAPFRDPRLALRLVELGGPPVLRFERHKLLPFYSRVATAIRKADPHHAVFIEPTALGGAVCSGLARPVGPDGKPHANVAFAPHYYEVATELRRPYEKTRERLHALLGRIARTGHGMDMPVWFGEWGNIPASLPNGRECIRDHLDGFDATLASWCYWEYGRRFARLPFLDLLTRPYPTAIAGRPTRLRVTAHRLELDIAEPIPGAETLVWLPPQARPAVEIRVTGDGQAAWRRMKSGAVAIRCSRGADGLHVTVRY